MRIVVCDADTLMREIVESLVSRAGHELAGIADSTAAAVGLIEAARPDAVVVDISLGFNTDFDMVEAAISVGALPIVFSSHGDAALLGSYEVHPTLVIKPDLAALENVLARLERTDQADTAFEGERRHHPARSASGRPPTGPTDAQAFFEAINDAQAGDAMISVATSDSEAAERLAGLVRDTDRVLLLPAAVRLYLLGAGEDGLDSALSRLAASGSLGPECTITSIIVNEGEHGADAFERLKHAHG